MGKQSSPPAERASAVDQVETAWGAIVGHLREEAAWRSGQEVDPLSVYETRETVGAFSLTASFTCWEPVTDSGGAVAGQDWAGDVFDRVEEMVEAGGHALGELLEHSAAAGHAGGPFEAQWPAPGGWRDGCYVRLSLICWPALGSGAETGAGEAQAGGGAQPESRPVVQGRGDVSGGCAGPCDGRKPSGKAPGGRPGRHA